MTASHSAKRIQEIEKLQKQLQQLRKQRQQIAANHNNTSIDNQPKQVVIKQDKLDVKHQPVVSNNNNNNTQSNLFLGKHGQNNRFLSISKVETEEYFPRILTIAGVIPGLNLTEYQNTPVVLQTKNSNSGNMFLTKLPDNYQGEIVALPGTQAIGQAKDPVVVLIQPNELSITQLPVENDEYVILVIERDVKDVEWQQGKFYLWKLNDDDDTLKVGWSNLKPDTSNGAQLVGVVLLGMLEIRHDLRKLKSCWEEENEVYSM